MRTDSGQTMAVSAMQRSRATPKGVPASGRPKIPRLITTPAPVVVACRRPDPPCPEGMSAYRARRSPEGMPSSQHNAPCRVGSSQRKPSSVRRVGTTRPVR